MTELRRIKQNEEKNKQLKKFVADLSHDKQVLQDVLKIYIEARTEAGIGGSPAGRLPCVSQRHVCTGIELRRLR